MIRTANRPLRLGLVVLEVVLLAGLNVEQAVRLIVPPAPPSGEVLYFASGLAVGVLAVGRRRYPERITQLAASGIAISLVCSLVGYFAHLPAPFGGDCETLGLLLLVGAGCHRARPRAAGAIAVLGGLAMVLGPVLRYGLNSTALTVAVFWAVLWGACIAVGLMLRDGDTRREAALAIARNRERLALARELHDLVAHHITGVVVRTQAAQLTVADGPEHEVLQEIERAGAEALGAVRRLVMMLRSPEQTLPLTSGDLVETIEAAVDGSDGVTLELAPGLAELGVAPETVSTVHRVLLESLVNVRKHAPQARHVTVAVAATADQRYLRVDVRNDGVRHRRSAGGYGLIGMGERIDALDGKLSAGEHGDHGWRVLAELPLPGGVAATRTAQEEPAS
ncbi:sensor histidine kinase [Kribbella sp. NPDC004875]|uniref:sensor histidine kinase n=1 Tax=Kribbella sp. NPDC004875 TaxID=3364107 RepID=UPI0036925292